MKQVYLERAREILAILLNHLLVIAAIVTVFDMFWINAGMIPVCMLSLLVPFGYYYLTHRPQKLWAPPIFIVLLQVMFWLEKIMKANDWESFYIATALLYLMGCFFYYFIDKFLQFLSLNEKSASNIPKKQILQSGMKQTLVFGTGSLTVLLLTANIDWVKKIADRIGNRLLQILIAIFADAPMPPAPEEVPVEDVQNTASDIGTVVDREMFPVFVQEMAKTVVTGVVFLAFIGGCILLMLLIFEFIKMYLTPQKRKKNPQELKDDEDVREYCGYEKRSNKKEHVFLFLNHREKIRKIYQKKVLRRKKELIGENAQQLQFMTAKECCDRLAEQNLKRIYEKARYSAEEITGEDVKIAKIK